MFNNTIMIQRFNVDPEKMFNVWWLLFIAGLLSIGFGLFCLISALNAYMMMVHYSGLLLLFNGSLLFVVACYVRGNRRETEWLTVESAMDLGFAFCLLVAPVISFITFPFLIGPWMIGKGIIKAVAAVRLRSLGRVYILTAGALSIAFGVLIMYHPVDRADSSTIFIGCFELVMGVLYILDSIRFRGKLLSIGLSGRHQLR